MKKYINNKNFILFVVDVIVIASDFIRFIFVASM